MKFKLSSIILNSNDMLNYEITLEEVQKVTCAAKANKAVGVEGIPNEALKAHS